MGQSSKYEERDQELAAVPSQPGEQGDAVFGQADEGGPNYRQVGRFAASVLMMKTEIGLGVLSIPDAFDSLGIVPGVIILIAISVITTWSAYVAGKFKLNHPETYGVADAGELMFGVAGREGFAIAFCLLWIFVAGSAMLSVSISLNAMSTHGACTAIFVAVAAIGGFLVASIRTLGKVSSLAWIGMVSILAAIFTVTIATGVQDRPAAAPQTGPWDPQYKLFGEGTLAAAMAAISSIIFAFCGVPAYISIASEMADPRQFTFSLLLCRAVATSVYIVIGVVVYYYCGIYVASPALGSAGTLLKKICYGLAFPGLVVSMVLYLHLTAKYIFIRILRGTRHLAANTMIHWGTWLGCTSVITLIAYCIASGIPAFGGLVSLVGAVFGTLLCFLPMPCMWFYDNWNTKERTTWWRCMVAWSVFVFVIGVYLMVAGTYGSVVGLINIFAEDGSTGAWSCADNSNSV
ncbi:amino acid transporter [Hortaea werneckii]|nr:amino acid transporter [Hortaea werneckii]KAI6861404.1 amino acid transporter [Hortaea werneckii]